MHFLAAQVSANCRIKCFPRLVHAEFLRGLDGAFRLSLIRALKSAIVRAGPLDDAACGFSSLLGGNCEQIKEYNKRVNEINDFEKKMQAMWLRGQISGLDAVNNTRQFHEASIQITNYAREYYAYATLVARACDEGKLRKKKGYIL